MFISMERVSTQDRFFIMETNKDSKSSDTSDSTNKRQRREEEEKEEEDDDVVIETVLSTVSFSYAYHHYFSCLIILSLNFDFLWQKPNNKSGIMHILHNYCMMKMLDDLRNRNTFLEQQVQNLVIDQYKMKKHVADYDSIKKLKISAEKKLAKLKSKYKTMKKSCDGTIAELKSNISLAKKEQQNMDNMINEKGEMSDANEQREKLAKDTDDKTIHSSIQELKHVINRSQNRLSEDMILINNHLRTIEKMSQKNNIVTPSKTTKAACRDQETLSQYVRRRRNVNYKPSTKRAKTVADAHKALQVFTCGWKAIWNPDDECYFFVSRDMKEVSPFMPDPTASAVAPSARRGTKTIDIDINNNLVNRDEMSSELFKTVDDKKNEFNDNNDDDDKDEEPLTLKIDNKDTTVQK